jgi:hypothetical protein
MHPRWVQAAENAFSSLVGVRMRRPGRLPNLKTRPVLGATSSGAKGRVTDADDDSAASGGIM